MKKCIIMRGLPGSGKSHWVKSFVQKERENEWNRPCILSTDAYFMVDGKYIFDPAKLSENHNRALQEFVNVTMAGFSYIIVDNTNVRAFEIAPYYRLAEAFGYEVEIVWVIANPAVCLARNTHNVPEHIIKNMLSSFEPLPVWWNMRMVINN